MTIEQNYSHECKLKGHLLLSPIDAPLTLVWFKIKDDENGVKIGVNLGINQIRNFIKIMAKDADILGDFSNKSEKVMACIGMAMAGVSRQMMVEITNHRSLSSLDKYDESIELDVQATELVESSSIQHFRLQHSHTKKL